MNPRIEQLATCPLCASAKLSALRTPRRWIGEESAFSGLRGQLGLSKCRSCGVSFTNPRPSQELLNEFYNGNTYTCHTVEGSASAGAKADYLLDKLEPLCRLRTLLDFGCGSGAFLKHAHERGWAVSGFEPGRRGRESCQRLGLSAVGSLDELGDQRFGLITLHHVLEHIAEPVSALKELRRFLAPEGRIYVEVPNAKSLRARLATDYVRGVNDKVDERNRAFPIHLFYYSAKTLKHVFVQAGFKVEEIITVGLGLSEFFLEETSSQPCEARTKAVAQRSALSRAKHAVRDVFLASGLGENLGEIGSI